MGYGFRYDSTGTKCSGGVRPGTLTLCKWSKKWWGLPMVGHYNCRNARSSSSLSTHAEGRGADLHVHVRASEAPPTPAERVVGDAIWAFWIEHAETVGVQAVIWLDNRWDARTRQVKHYTGPYHGNHVHVELCRPASEALTEAVLNSLEADQEDDMTPEQMLELKTHIDARVNAAADGIVVTLSRRIGEIPGAGPVDEEALAAEVVERIGEEALGLMKTLAGVTAFLAYSLGLVTYEIVTLVVAAIGMVAAVVALIWCGVNAVAIRDINDRQGERIDRLAPPGGG